LVFEKNANFFAENCQKSQKIVIITSTPGGVRSIWSKAGKDDSLIQQFSFEEFVGF
jgi:hypothetical protein